jgi:ATP-binding cassette subfamily F protein 3
VDARLLFDAASSRIAKGWKVGLVGRNGTGKSTLLRLIREDIEAAGRGRPPGSIKLARGARMGHVAQEIPASDTPLLEVVLAADVERSSLLEEAETATDPNRIAEIHIRLADIDAYTAEARAGEILTGLGFTQEDLTRPARAFSGGWRMRAALGGVLLSTPDLLLLDEPTNYLDLEGAAWLENYIKRYPGTVLLVSHDREMLNRCVTHIMALEACKLVIQPGTYDQYIARRAERAAQLVSAREKQSAQKAHLQSFIDRFRAQATKARQAQSRIKMLQRMQDIPEPLEERTIPFKFENPSELASPLVVMDGCDVGYVSGKPVLRHVSLRIDNDDRVAIVGTNGQGKTTLVKSIAAKLALLKGERVSHGSLRIGYFSQDQMDELHPGETALDHVRTLRPEVSQSAHRAIAAQIGFPKEKIDTPAESLSGGEKVRLLMGLMAMQKPHILILDEPTSHLDIDSREALIYAINGFQGAVLLITHDIYLAEACADRLWLVKDGRVGPYDGDLSDYRALVLAADRTAQANATKPAQTAQMSGNAAGADAATSAAPRPSASTLRRRMEEAERKLTQARANLETVDERLSAAKGPEVAVLLKKRETLAGEIAGLEETWLAAAEMLEGA